MSRIVKVIEVIGDLVSREELRREGGCPPPPYCASSRHQGLRPGAGPALA